jgi:hypothetical protein
MVRFRYIRERGTRKPIGCIAYELVDTEPLTAGRSSTFRMLYDEIQFAWSFCNSCDQWDSKKARLIAEGRLRKGQAVDRSVANNPQGGWRRTSVFHWLGSTFNPSPVVTASFTAGSEPFLGS